MKVFIALLAALGTVTAAPGAAEGNVRRAEAVRYCSPVTQLCYNEYKTEGTVLYRFAIPANATYGQRFDIALQMTTPRNMAGWAALSWGGNMINAPITLGWPTPSSRLTVSSRFAIQYAMPNVYSDATYTVLQDTAVNGTHWTLSVVCKGCSQWTPRSGAATKILNPASRVRVAWSQNTAVSGAVAQPDNPSSSFSIHHYHNYIDVDLNSARAQNWDQAVSRVLRG